MGGYGMRMDHMVNLPVFYIYGPQNNRLVTLWAKCGMSL